MFDRALPILTLTALTPLLASAREPDAFAMAGTQWAQVIIHERMVIRIPRTDSNDNARPLYRAPPTATGWRENRAPKCVSSDSIVAAAMDGGDVDLEMVDGARVRAKLGDDCPTLKFYTGFYLKRTSDGMICAGRDALRSRSGARCDIVRFRALVAQR
ncbi:MULTISPECIES: hypothetical protein [Sphingomonas]|uniref:DUF3617 family protein n=1 Tax=Sphingomonas lycopersici TaxID=2951807 RepID=A0AA42CV47_9SPHN|nr:MULTISPECIES: hypothetical protein [Sphingomonas]MCW6532471.1 hypothetical protein [Sphingomonas lycopersici]MCW6536121.1 hypothetical protein [Sphingomonas lycopersici]OJU16454.1 MAG: hypothetical protein BGN95_05570 [Sphingomonas sp. 66-10]